MGSRLTRKVRRLLFDRRAVNIAISNLILAGAVVALGFAVLSWTYSRSSVYNMEYANLIEANSDRIKEKLVFEYIFYNTSGNLTVYLINCGKSNDVSLAHVYLSNSSWFRSFPDTDIELRFLNGTSTESLDIGEEGYFQLSVSLVTNTSYSIRIVTGRGRSFDATFIA
ncbi:MAG: hypothetical protein ACE5OW_05675 [Candidatus Bathyarchaeia archaeon]